MSGSTLGWSGDSNDPVNLAVNIGKLQTFCRNLEDRIEKNEDSKVSIIEQPRESVTVTEQVVVTIGEAFGFAIVALSKLAALSHM